MWYQAFYGHRLMREQFSYPLCRCLQGQPSFWGLVGWAHDDKGPLAEGLPWGRGTLGLACPRGILHILK